MQQPTLFTTTQPTIDGKPPPTYKEHMKKPTQRSQRYNNKGGGTKHQFHDPPSQPTHTPTGVPLPKPDPMDQEQWSHFNHAMEACRKEQELDPGDMGYSPSPIPFHYHPKHKMANLLDWHATCPGSQVYPPEDPTMEDHYPEAYGPPDDPPMEDHRYPTGCTVPLPRRKPHYDE